MSQQPDRASLLKAAIALRDIVRSGEVTMVCARQAPFHPEADSDRISFRFVSGGDSIIAYYYASRGVVKSYDSGVFRSMDPREGVFARPLSAEAAWDHIQEDVPRLAAFPWKLVDLLKDSSAQLNQALPSALQGGFIIEKHTDSTVGDFTSIDQRYCFEKNGLLRSVESSAHVFGGIASRTYRIDSFTINRTSESDVHSLVQAAFPDMPVHVGEEHSHTIYVEDTGETPCPMKGQPLPSFHGLTATGKTVEIRSLLGKYLILDFWFSGCPPCFRAKPALRRLQAKFSSLGVEVVGIDPVDTDSTIFAAASHDDAYLNLRVPAEVEALFKVDGYPSFFVVSPDEHIAGCVDTADEIESYITSLISPKPGIR